MSIGRCLPKAKRVWVIGSLEARAEGLAVLHSLIANSYKIGDIIVYTGNIFGGINGNIPSLIDEILDFRKKIMATFETKSEDICYIRGAYEDMLFKMFSLNFANKPIEKYMNMMASGLKYTLDSYGVSVNEGKMAAEQGSVSLLRFIENLKSKIRAHDGHYELLFSKSLVNYVYTDDKNLLLLSAGLDKSKTLEEQKEEIAYGASKGASKFKGEKPYEGFKTVVRGKAFEILEDGVFYDTGYMTINPINRLYSVLFDEKGKPITLLKV